MYIYILLHNTCIQTYLQRYIIALICHTIATDIQLSPHVRAAVRQGHVSLIFDLQFTFNSYTMLLYMATRVFATTFKHAMFCVAVEKQFYIKVP